MRLVPLRRLFSDATGGSWGDEPGSRDIDLPCVRGTDFNFPALRTAPTRSPVRSYSRSEVVKRSAHRGDLIVEKSGGGDQQPVGRCVLHDSELPVMPTNFAGRLRPATGVEPRFASYVMASLYYGGLTRACIKQTTGIQNLDLDLLLTTVVPLPDSSIQRAVADFLDRETARIDGLLAAKRSMVALLEERLKCQIGETTRRGLNPSALLRDSGCPWIGAIPKHWMVVPNRSLLELRRAIVGADHHGITLLSLTRAGVIVRDVSENFGKFPASFDTYQAVAAGDLVFCLFDIPETPRTVGLATQDGMVTGAYTVFRPKQAASSKYLDYLYRGIDNEKSLSLFYSGLRNVIRLDAFASMKCPLPPQDEQLRIVDFLDSLSLRSAAIADATVRQISLLQERRSALITAAVTGQLEIPGAVA